MKILVILLVILAGIGFFIIAKTAVETEAAKPVSEKQSMKRTTNQIQKIEVTNNDTAAPEKTHFKKEDLDEMRASLLDGHLKFLAGKLAGTEAAIAPAIQEEFSTWQKEILPAFAKRCREKKLHGFDAEYSDAVSAAVNRTNKLIAQALSRTPDEIERLRADFIQKMYFAKEED